MIQLKVMMPPESFIPILVLTVDVSPEAKQKALAGGASDFLTKPFDLIEVDLRIRNLLKARNLHLQLQNHNLILEKKVKERTTELEKTNKELPNAKLELINDCGHVPQEEKPNLIFNTIYTFIERK